MPWDSNSHFCSHTLIFLAFGAERALSVFLFLFLGLVLQTRLTVRVMLVGVCCVAVYNTVEGESSSSQLSVALLSPPTKENITLTTFIIWRNHHTALQLDFKEEMPCCPPFMITTCTVLLQGRRHSKYFLPGQMLIHKSQGSVCSKQTELTWHVVLLPATKSDYFPPANCPTKERQTSDTDTVNGSTA